MEDELVARIEGATGVRTLTTAGGLTAALCRLGARRIELVTPYLPEVTAREVTYFEAHGFEVVSSASYGMNNELGDGPGERGHVARLRANPPRRHGGRLRVQLHRYRKRRTCCRRWRTRSAGRVLTSNQAIAWHVQRAGGVDDPVPGFGALMRTSAATVAA